MKSLERAAEIGKKKRQFYVCVLPANDKGETAVLSNTVDLSKVLTEFVSCDINGEIIQEPDKGNSITRINPSATIQFGEDSYAELSNVTLDGGSLTANVPLVSVIGSSEGQGLSLNKGTIIQNAKSSGDCGGMSIGQNGHVVMIEASILNCSATGENSVGGIKNEQISQGLDLQGGTISGCVGTTAGGIYQNGGNKGGMRLTDDGIIKILDNFKSNGEKSNLYIAENSSVLLGAKELEEGSSVGVSSAVAPTEESPVEVVVGPFDEKNKPLPIETKGFVSDSENYKFKYLDGETKNRIGLELKTEFTITATAAANGTISPSGNITVKEGQSQSFTTTPSTGYDIADVVVDGKSVGAQASYTFENISENHSIVATFKVKSNEQYSVTIQTDGTGTAAASVTSAAKGTIVSLKATPSNGYQFKAWQVVSGNLKIENNQFTMPAENVILKAVFEKTPANGGNIKTGMTDTKTGTASAIMLLSIAGISLLVFKRKLNKK